MPATSIDMFFACTLVVSVALIATAFFAGTMQTQINSMQDLNKYAYLQTIADHIVSSCGSPVDWGSGSSVPVNFGLSLNNSAGLFELDIDKLSRLSSQNMYALSYPDISKAARLTNIAFGVSLSQMLSIDVVLSGNTTVSGFTTYTFTVLVSQDSGPLSANLQGYLVATNFVGSASNTTSSSGVGYVSVQVPTTSSGPALLVVFARASFDDRITAYEVYSFAHLSQNPSSNYTFLGLSPLNYTLNVHKNYPSLTINGSYAFSYGYSSNLTSTSSTTYAIPALLDKSPIVLVAQGVNGTATFVEWTSYPPLPVDTGADFSNSTENVFVYPVTVKDALYKLILHFGDVVR
ncbi:hypothetical protein MUP38_06345 [Candidatus Bathyarchaeota archaeon]|nr:hypothetical protein [Candidatus Bathyarchaeota archaeon]